MPEAQLDRFLLKISLGYPNKGEEVAILERFQRGDPLTMLEPVADPQQIIRMQQLREEIKVSAPVREYIADLVVATRDNEGLRFGSSPRGSLGLMRAAQGLAALRGRKYVLPDDVKRMVCPVLSHRSILNEEGKLRGELPEHVLEDIIHRIPVPA